MFTDLLIENFNKRIKSERKQWGMSRRRLGKLSFSDAETIEEIENGNYDNLDFRLLVNICDALQISAFSFLKEGTTIEQLLKVI